MNKYFLLGIMIGIVFMFPIIVLKIENNKLSDENDKLFFSEKIYTVTDTFLKKIDLAYALTVHKLQGSQANLIICVMYPVGYNSFISRNMIYTALTRAVKGIYLVGDVIGRNNAISRGRKIEQNSRKLTITDKLY